MSKNKRTTAKKSKTNLPPYLLALGAVCAVLIIAVVVSAIVAANREPKVEFIPPEFEAAAVAGVPEVPDNMGYAEIFKDGMTFSAWLCGAAAQENGEAVVYFTNPAENTEWLKLRIYSEDNTLLGETGLLKPGEYIRSVPLDGTVSSGSNIKMRIMGYEPDTYLSAGSVTMNTVIQ